MAKENLGDVQAMAVDLVGLDAKLKVAEAKMSNFKPQLIPTHLEEWAKRASVPLKRSEETGSQVRYIRADMSKPDECRALIEQAGACDILVNNAGIQHVANIEDFPPEKWDAIIAINKLSRTMLTMTQYIQKKAAVAR